MNFLLDSDDDWIETVRRRYYPRLHPYLKRVGGYGIGHVGQAQYVGTFDESEDVIEDELDDRGRRNPIACFKSLHDGRKSEGSWAILHTDSPDLVAPGMQLHLTLFERKDSKPGRELYAHYEDDWRVSPIKHLREANFDVATGVELTTKYVNEHTFLELK